MALITYIGALVSVSAGPPATVDAAGFAAKTYSTVGKITEWGETGDQSEDVTETTLEGRTYHANGALDGGSIPFTFLIDGVDAGQTLLRTANNTNDEVSARITDPDGQIIYYHGKVANLRDRARNASTIKGLTGEFRVNSATVRV
ncbi:hypothetical protein E4191_07605 [Paracoccus liaowanqingii]|uniref:Phage tail protein n=1 Tax=Paracoccus liaowanqingii TaxID=2560053 RepID=A0A4P7HLP1_9RHOB|nr:hypothetical protein [Paracoccus liaowanqingii]QBX34590.1 hypothetical protein E4191_07605 [Paracoccus liaowanqingii]